MPWSSCRRLQVMPFSTGVEGVSRPHKAKKSLGLGLGLPRLRQVELKSQQGEGRLIVELVVSSGLQMGLQTPPPEGPALHQQDAGAGVELSPGSGTLVWVEAAWTTAPRIPLLHPFLGVALVPHSRAVLTACALTVTPERLGHGLAG